MVKNPTREWALDLSKMALVRREESLSELTGHGGRDQEAQSGSPAFQKMALCYLPSANITQLSLTPSL
ncbi:unnamed protein product [Linum trigynum]|uniref:Uncharacterized protein n=1 Tax=Linum trigynum TaxID=586398 RepID=A0AAV2FV24_9ROSI